MWMMWSGERSRELRRWLIAYLEEAGRGMGIYGKIVYMGEIGRREDHIPHTSWLGYQGNKQDKGQNNEYMNILPDFLPFHTYCK